MHAAWIWVAALLLYALFSLWYVNWRGPLRPEEIAPRLETLAARGIDGERLAAVRRFLEADDGREFFMVNLIRLPEQEVARPDTGALEPPRRVLEGYTRPFMTALFRRAGHPAFAGPAAGAYLEAWNVAPDPGWTFAGVIRYRSRRDMLELATDPFFEPAHVFKRAAIETTLAFPVSPAWQPFGPRVAVGVGLLLLASLGHLALLVARGNSGGA